MTEAGEWFLQLFWNFTLRFTKSDTRDENSNEEVLYVRYGKKMVSGTLVMRACWDWKLHRYVHSKRLNLLPVFVYFCDLNILRYESICYLIVCYGDDSRWCDYSVLSSFYSVPVSERIFFLKKWITQAVLRLHIIYFSCFAFNVTFNQRQFISKKPHAKCTHLLHIFFRFLNAFLPCFYWNICGMCCLCITSHGTYFFFVCVCVVLAGIRVYVYARDVIDSGVKCPLSLRMVDYYAGHPNTRWCFITLLRRPRHFSTFDIPSGMT